LNYKIIILSNLTGGLKIIMSLERLTQTIVEFRDKREWKQFHNPKDLAISLSIEASELLECFQWKNNNEINELLKSDSREDVEEEIADIGNYLLLLCNELGIDLIKTIEKKLIKNEIKYPVEKSKGNSTKYNKL